MPNFLSTILGSMRQAAGYVGHLSTYDVVSEIRKPYTNKQWNALPLPVQMSIEKAEARVAMVVERITEQQMHSGRAFDPKNDIGANAKDLNEKEAALWDLAMQYLPNGLANTNGSPDIEEAQALAKDFAWNAKRHYMGDRAKFSPPRSR